MRTELTEFELLAQITEFLKIRFPKILFRADLGGVRLPIGLAAKLKKVNPDTAGWPDLQIVEARQGFHGLFLELKKERSLLYTKAGNFRKTAHLTRQKEILSLLAKRGYAAYFVCGFEEAKQAIEAYLN